ncbi:MAG: bifunctional 3-(3-hydroxy-phenyl)propionate/3-hydroxycinnamic acid hydroxylase [Chloroflexi bacterium]|nr:bifunctional 3-(3-hydroxy-phenyl)propionate/3-hydroxycinnamic acid hydroxylase [Chloroflexota bacterium]
MSDNRYDVIVVGYGPVGQIAANLLGQAGMRVAVYETATGIYDLPRAVGFDAEIMRVFQSVGLAEAILPSTTPIKGYDFVTGDGEKLFGFDPPQPPTFSGWASNYMFYQPELEAALRSGVERFSSVQVHTGHEVIDIRQNDSGVEVDVRELSTEAESTVSADYVIGCDGGRSITRKIVGTGLEDLNFNQPWLVIDVMLKRDVDLPDHATQICEPTRPTTFIPSRGNHRRWEFMLMPGDDPESISSTDRVWELLSPWIGSGDADVIRAVVYTFHALIADRWRDRRVLLAGDAAHQMPPFLGQGMCSGIRDAANLAWKLDLVCRGSASDALLDTYQLERSPHVRAITERAMHLGSIIQTSDPEIAKVRDERFRSAPGRRFTIDDDTGPLKQRLPGLNAGVIDRVSDDSRVGQLFPQGLVALPDGDEALLDDVIGQRFAIVVAEEAASSNPQPAFGVASFISPALITLTSSETGASDGWTRVADRTGVVTEWLNGAIAVVRPDRYVYGIASNVGELSALTGSLRQQLLRTEAHV